MSKRLVVANGKVKFQSFFGTNGIEAVNAARGLVVVHLYIKTIHLVKGYGVFAFFPRQHEVSVPRDQGLVIFGEQPEFVKCHKAKIRPREAFPQAVGFTDKQLPAATALSSFLIGK